MQPAWSGVCYVNQRAPNSDIHLLPLGLKVHYHNWVLSFFQIHERPEMTYTWRLDNFGRWGSGDGSQVNSLLSRGFIHHAISLAYVGLLPKPAESGLGS